MPRTYTLTGPDGQQHKSSNPGALAGWYRKRIFGRLDCSSGTRLMAPGNRIFFADLETAVRAGYRPCQKCRPLDEEGFREFKRRLPDSILPERTLEEFYRRS